MATDKMFTVVGTSKLDGEYKVRFANDIMRVKVLAKHGHKDVTLVELDEAVSKLDAAIFIKSLDEFAGPNEQAAIDEYIEKNTPKEPKVAKPVKASKAKVEKAIATVLDEADEIAAAEEVVSDMENEPF
jgi:predicted metal-dependent RNase